VTSTDRADPRMTNDIDGILPTLRDAKSVYNPQHNTLFDIIGIRASCLAKN
jgi:hypothetical protein